MMMPELGAFGVGNAVPTHRTSFTDAAAIVTPTAMAGVAPGMTQFARNDAWRSSAPLIL
jgi:hypothetical protein